MKILPGQTMGESLISINTLQIVSPTASDDFSINPLTSKNFRVAIPAGRTALRIIDYSGSQIKINAGRGKRMVDVDINALAGVYKIQVLN